MALDLVRTLTGGGAPAREVGGKAAALDRLVGDGFPVPPATALTAHAYRRFVDAAGLRPFLESLSRAELPPPDRLEAEAARVDRAFLDAPMPAEVEESIRKAAWQLLADTPIAVRSSATAEDLAAASFAGQYRTFLDVETEEAMLDAVRRCWASLWGPSVRAYRRRESVPEDDLAMGVIFQAMAPAQWAGVLFTRDPQGEPNVARVEAVRGLGEDLVSGRVTPNDYRVDRGNLQIRGDEEAPGFLEDLARLGLRIERRMGSPQDIEWAHDGSRLLVLQSRPITIEAPLPSDDDGFDTEPAPGATYSPVGVQEMLPGVLPPLLWTINAPMLDDAFRRLFSDLGIPAPRRDGRFLALGRFRGRAALDLSVLRAAARAIPGGSAAEVERQYLGRVLTDEDPAPSGGRLRRAAAAMRAFRIRRRVEDEVGLFSESVHFTLALGVRLSDLPARRLLAYRARVRELAWRGYGAEVAAAAGAAAAYRGVELALERWVGPDRAPLWAQRLTSGFAPAQETGRSFAEEVWDLYAGHPASRIGSEDERLLSLARRAIRHLGSAAVYGGKAWDEDVGEIRRRIGPMLRRAGDRDAGVAPAAVRARRDQAFEELRMELKDSWRYRATRILTGQLVDVRRRLLRKLAHDASRFLSLRERAKASLLVLGGEERRIILEAARRLAASGSLSDPEDVLFLADHELEEMVLGGEPVSPEEIARRRSSFRRMEEDDPLPEVFSGQPGVEAPVPLDGDRLEGWAASPGRVRGRARVLRSLAEGRDLEQGEIIVARVTDPSWTPLFLCAGGIVLEEGGPLSHAAIVAREFGLPAVLNVKGATRSLHTGDEVELDGTTGAVVRVAQEDVA